MDETARSRAMAELAAAERFVAQGAENLFKQEQRVARLRRSGGHDMSLHETLLETFREAHTQ